MTSDPVAEWAEQKGVPDLGAHIQAERGEMLRRERAVRRGACPECDGNGHTGPVCDSCDSTGDCECHCGDEHPCGECQGLSGGPDCTACDGTGRLREEQSA